MTSYVSSARYTVSVPPPESRFLSFILTTDALRPDLVNSAFWTTIGLGPTMITLPARTSCASFISGFLMGDDRLTPASSRGFYGDSAQPEIIVDRRKIERAARRGRALRRGAAPNRPRALQGSAARRERMAMLQPDPRAHR